MKLKPLKEKWENSKSDLTNQEKQYFQQLQKQPTQRKDNSKPDW